MLKIESIKKDGYKINIYAYESPESPREWDNLGTLELTHNRYNLAQEGPGLDFEPDEDSKCREGWDAALENLKKEVNPVLILPVSGYDHGGLSLFIGESFDRWDGGRLGFIYITKEKLEAIGLAKENRTTEKLTEYLENELKTYNQYLEGEVYGYIIEDKDGQEFGGCWGFYGDDHETSGLMDHAKEDIAGHVRELEEDTDALRADVRALVNNIQDRLRPFKKDEKLKNSINRNVKSILTILEK